ncbi:MAG: P-II family nitrogen regulator [Planctomycetota bacterium]
MKLVIAYIRPERFDEVKAALVEKEIRRFSVISAEGRGLAPAMQETYRGSGLTLDMSKRIRIEIGVNDEFVERAVDAIVSTASTGEVGDGEVFIIPMDDCVRIRTGERGTTGIG